MVSENQKIDWGEKKKNPHAWQRWKFTFSVCICWHFKNICCLHCREWSWPRPCSPEVLTSTIHSPASVRVVPPADRTGCTLLRNKALRCCRGLFTAGALFTSGPFCLASHEACCAAVPDRALSGPFLDCPSACPGLQPLPLKSGVSQDFLSVAAELEEDAFPGKG